MMIQDSAALSCCGGCCAMAGIATARSSIHRRIFKVPPDCVAPDCVAPDRVTPDCFKGFGMCGILLSLCRDVSVGFDFHQYFGRDQRADLDHGGGGTNVGKEFSMSFTDLFPLS